MHTYKEASQYRAHRSTGGIKTTDHLLGIESLVWADAEYIQSPSVPLVKGGKKVSLKATKKTTFA